MAPGKRSAGSQQRMPCEQDPLAEFLSEAATPNKVDFDPAVAEWLQKTESEEASACEDSSVGASSPEGCGAASIERQKELEKRLHEMQSENLKLRRQVKQQFQDLSELDSVLGELEVQVDGHEVVIKQQDQKIQEQEEMIQELHAKMQQYVAALVCNAFRPTQL